MKKIFILFLFIIILGGCNLKSGDSINETKLIGAVKGVYNENDILSKINQLKDNNMSQQDQSGEQNNSASPTQDQNNGIQLEDLFSKYNQALIRTNKGNIKVQFYPESPLTVNNFMNLATKEFYNGTKFHRVIKDFMVQGGDPNSKDDDWSNDGIGGPGYSFQDEINQHKLVRGSLAMANSGPNTNGSQFFIVTASETSWLDGKHTNFGYVVEGMDIINKIEEVAVNENSHPTEDIVIDGIELLHSDDGYKLNSEELEDLKNNDSTSTEENIASTTEE